MRISVTGFHKISMKEETVSVPILTRWHEQYKRRLLAKLYNLDKWYIDSGRPPVTMCTLTTKQKEFTRLEQIDFLNQCRSKFIDLFRKNHKGVQYIYVYEPHKSGYAHIHFLFFCTVSKQEIKNYKKYWNKKLNAGGFSSAIDFSRSVRNSTLNSAKNYAMKYIRKSLTALSDNVKKYAGCVSLLSSRQTDCKGIRLFGTSQLLGRAIAVKRSGNLIAKTVRIEDTNGNIINEKEVKGFRERVLSFVLGSLPFDILKGG